MAKYQVSRTFPGRSVGDCYHAAETALSEVGFDVWKKRPLGWFMLARYEDEASGPVRANAACRPAADALVTLALDADRASEETLETLAEQVLAAMAAELS